MKAVFEAAKKQTSATKELGLEELCESNKGFRFDFNIPTNEKKKRKSKKKKKKAKSASAEENDNDNDNDGDDNLSECAEDESPCVVAEVVSPDSPTTNDTIEEAERDANKGSSAISNAEEAKNTSSIAKEEPRPRKEQSKDSARTAPPQSTEPTITTTTTTANAAKTNKKKKKKPKKKDTVETEKDDFDEIIERVIAQNKKNELAAAERQPSVRPPPGLSKGSGPRFVSPNDPELDPKTRLIAKYGQGKNLVAVGPRRMKDPFWLKDNSPDYENQIAKSMAEVVLNEPQHTPFTFSFGLG